MKKLAESAIQQKCTVEFNNRYCLVHHSPRLLIMSVPNESDNSWDVQKKINMGLLKGASDSIIILPGVPVFMECKTEIGVQSPAQKAFQLRVEALGFRYFLYRSVEQFWQIINPFLLSAGLEAYNG